MNRSYNPGQQVSRYTTFSKKQHRILNNSPRLALLLGHLIDDCYMWPFSRLFSRELFRYAVCGGGNMVLDALYYFLIYHFLVAERFIDLGFVVISPHIASLILVFPITFFNGFWLNRHVAFQSTRIRSYTQLLRYLITVLGAILLNYLLMKILVERCGLWPTPSKLTTTCISAVYSFLAAKYFTFRK